MLIVDIPCAVPRYQPDEETCRLWSVNPMEHSRGWAPAPSQLKVVQVEENKGIDESSDQLRKIGAWGLDALRSYLRLRLTVEMWTWRKSDLKVRDCLWRNVTLLFTSRISISTLSFKFEMGTYPTGRGSERICACYFFLLHLKPS